MHTLPPVMTPCCAPLRHGFSKRVARRLGKCDAEHAHALSFGEEWVICGNNDTMGPAGDRA